MRTCYSCIYILCRQTPEGIDSQDTCVNPGGEGYEKSDFDPYEDDQNCDQYRWDEDPNLNYDAHDCDQLIEINSEYSACSQCGDIQKTRIK